MGPQRHGLLSRLLLVRPTKVQNGAYPGDRAWAAPLCSSWAIPSMGPTPSVGLKSLLVSMENFPTQPFMSPQGQKGCRPQDGGAPRTHRSFQCSQGGHQIAGTWILIHNLEATLPLINIRKGVTPVHALLPESLPRFASGAPSVHSRSRTSPSPHTP